ncbi:MAG TPA: response regulator [Lacibacter sp.]|jgi:CheY-like chemotaxis protein|nr:response regulator [Lacibacter sp.]
MKTHVFLIDDDIEEMRFFVKVLNEMGDSFKCTYASNGAHALKMLQYLRPEKIFIKYNLPLMNGLEVIEELRKLKDLEPIPVFLFSSHIDQKSRQRALALGITLCMDKPDSKIDLETVLKNVFESPAVLSTANETGYIPG